MKGGLFCTFLAFYCILLMQVSAAVALSFSLTRRLRREPLQGITLHPQGARPSVRHQGEHDQILGH